MNELNITPKMNCLEQNKQGLKINVKFSQPNDMKIILDFFFFELVAKLSTGIVY